MTKIETSKKKNILILLMMTIFIIFSTKQLYSSVSETYKKTKILESITELSKSQKTFIDIKGFLFSNDFSVEKKGNLYILKETTISLKTCVEILHVRNDKEFTKTTLALYEDLCDLYTNSEPIILEKT